MSGICARLCCGMMVLAVGHSAKGSPPPPDPGLAGLRAARLLSLQTDNKGTRDSTLDLSDPCGDIAELFARAGLPVVEGFRDDPAVGVVFLGVDRSAPQEAGVLYLAAISLSQEMRLVREPDRKVSLPVTYDDQRYGLVAAADAKEKTCEELRAMVTQFLKQWRGWNERD